MKKMNFRIRAFAIHLLVSALIAALVAAVIFLVWYPKPFQALSSGAELFGMIVSIDVIIGPLLTLAVSRPGKSLRALRFDYVVIAILQLAALGYGTWTMAQARPVHMVWEKDLFRVAHVADLEESDVSKAPADITVFPWTGPDIIAVKISENREEKEKVLFDALRNGFEAFNPALWVPYEQARAEVMQKATPLAKLLEKHPEQKDAAMQIVNEKGKTVDDVLCASVVGRNYMQWTVLLDKGDMQPIGYLHANLIEETAGKQEEKAVENPAN